MWMDTTSRTSEQVPTPVQTGWTQVGRCPQDANWVHVEEAFDTGAGDAVRVEELQHAGPLGGVMVTPTRFGFDQSVNMKHACGVPATMVGPGEAPLKVDRAEDVDDGVADWATYRGDYGLGTEDLNVAHKAFMAGFKAGRRGDQSSPLR